jgi:hypothetical protein
VTINRASGLNTHGSRSLQAVFVVRRSQWLKGAEAKALATSQQAVPDQRAGKRKEDAR